MVSLLETDIDLPIPHAEYVALSQSIRDLLPFKALDKETLKGLGLNTKKLKVVTQSLVFEDNVGSIVGDYYPFLTPSSEFIAVKCHWFHSHIEYDKLRKLMASLTKKTYSQGLRVKSHNF